MPRINDICIVKYKTIAKIHKCVYSITLAYVVGQKAPVCYILSLISVQSIALLCMH